MYCVYVRHVVFMSGSLKFAVIRGATPCGLVDVY